MSEQPVLISKSGKGGHITLNRPKALNALSWEMCLLIEAALEDWRKDDSVELVVIDAAGDRAFCAGGDIARVYQSGLEKDYDYGRKFWTDEYRLNAKLANYPKPIVSFMHGFVMGGGVGIGCHVSHRVVGESSKVAMPESGIGLIPDVGGTLLLANAPGRMGEYLGLTGNRMSAGDAIYCNFADTYLPEAEWADLKLSLLESGDIGLIPQSQGTSELAKLAYGIDTHFGASDLMQIVASLETSSSVYAEEALITIRRNSPLSMACTLEMVRQMRGDKRIEDALELEYRFTYRALEHGDFAEGTRAQVIDKDRNPVWQHSLGDDVAEKTAFMLSSLGEDRLNLEEPS